MKNKINHYIPSGCSTAGVISVDRELVSGEIISRMIARMHQRANGLGGGFAGYGIYPNHEDEYAFHIMYENEKGKSDCEEFIEKNTNVLHKEEIPTRPVDVILNRPILCRYFVKIKNDVKNKYYDMTQEDIIMFLVMEINSSIVGAFVFSSGKNMGIFKGVGYPEDIAKFYRLEEYKAYMWTAHGRFPTNTPGWWGGAHPFGLLDWSLVHNGEISSYGANKRYLEEFGYKLTLHTDSEAILYALDLLVRKHNLDFKTAAIALAPPLWDEIKNNDKKELLTAIRAIYGGAMLNGPSAIIISWNGGMMGLNDRVKLRPLVAGRKNNKCYLSSEECAIREVEKELDELKYVPAGTPVIFKLK
ncbi:MAG: class II glutamine amidotransferase [Elusimicrobiota bacterium]